MSLKKSLFQQNRRHTLDRMHSSNSVLNLSSEYHTQNAIISIAANEHNVCALVSRQEIELVSLEGRHLTHLNKVRANQYMPTSAEWQPKVPNPKLAVGDSNGSFHLYDLHDQCELVYTHCCGSLGRSVKSLSFNSEQPNLLITAVSDGSTKLWDLRTSLKHSVQSFVRVQDVARECEFQPMNDHAFAVVYDSGIVQRWDLRQKHADVKINAHQQGLSLSWHHSMNYLATGGRDKLVHVWNMDKPTERPVYTLQTPTTVSQLHWVPNSEVQDLYFSVQAHAHANSTNSTHSNPNAYSNPHSYGNSSQAHISHQSGYSGHSETDALSSNRIVCAGKSGDIDFLRRTLSVYELKKPYTPLHVIETHGSAISDISVHGSHCVLSADTEGKFVRTDLRHEPLLVHNLSPRVLAWPSWDSPAINIIDSNAASIDTGRRQSVPTMPGKALQTSSLSPVSLGSSPTSTANSVYGSPLNLGFLSSSLGSVGSRRHSTMGPGVQTPLPTISTSLVPNIHTSEHYVAEIELPFCNESTDASFSQSLLFTRKSSQSFSEACLQNAETMLSLNQYKLSEMWQMLKVAIVDSETAFLEQLQNSHDRQLVKQWFDGLGDCEEPVLVEDELALFDDDDEEVSSANPANLSTTEETEWDFNMHTKRGARRSTCGTTSSNRPKLHCIESDAFRAVKERYCEFVLSSSLPWDLLPLLQSFIHRVVLTGSYITATSLLIMFRHFPCLYDQIDAKEIIYGGILSLQRNSAWVSATSVIKLLPLIKELDFKFDPFIEPELVCHRCLHSLAENTGMEGDNVQLWYCSRCKQALDGCSLCSRVIRGLCKVILECGHRVHLHCWDVWKQEGINECPSGCGQVI